MVASLLPRAVKLQALLHDATEAYLGDMVKPLKRLLADYRAVERKVWRAITSRFGIPEEPDPAVKAAGLIALATEPRDLLQHPYRWKRRVDENIVPAAERTLPLAPTEAEQAFLEEFERLSR